MERIPSTSKINYVKWIGISFTNIASFWEHAILTDIKLGDTFPLLLIHKGNIVLQLYDDQRLKIVVNYRSSSYFNNVIIELISLFYPKEPWWRYLDLIDWLICSLISLHPTCFSTSFSFLHPFKLYGLWTTHIIAFVVPLFFHYYKDHKDVINQPSKINNALVNLNPWVVYMLKVWKEITQGDSELKVSNNSKRTLLTHFLLLQFYLQNSPLEFGLDTKVSKDLDLHSRIYRLQHNEL